MVHIGIEQSIVGQYQVPHALKERIVDRFVFVNFVDALPEYRVQNMGYAELDNVLRDQSDLENLHRVVEQFLDR